MTSTKSKINFILNKLSNWIQWFFIIQDIVKTNKVWQHVGSDKKKDNIPILELPNWPTPADIHPMVTLIAQLDWDQFSVYN